MTTYHHLLFSLENHIARVTLNRPPVNALNKELVSELIDIAGKFRSDDAIWTVVVNASGKTFCAGADLKERAGVPQDEVMTFVSGIQSVSAAWCDIPQPVIMCIHGAALGGGLEFALAGDIIIAAESAVLGLPETSLGIIPAAGGTQRLAQRSSSGTARKWIITAQHFSAQSALQDGVIDYCFPDGSFAEECEKIILKIASNAPIALRQAKKAIQSSYDDWLLDGFANEKTYYEPLVATEDRKEALKAFAEKRNPVWKGK